MAIDSEGVQDRAPSGALLVIEPERRYFRGMKQNFDAITARAERSVIASDAFQGFLRENNLRLSDVIKCGARGPITGYRFPRNLPWKDLPIIEKPEIGYAIHGVNYDFGVGPGGLFGGSGVSKHYRHEWLPEESLGDVRVVVIDGIEPTDRLIRRHTVMFDHLECSELPEFFIYLREKIIPVNRERVFSLRAAFEAEERFDFAHSLNASILVGRALYDLGRKLDLPRDWLRIIPITGSQRPYSFPLVLQVLFELRRSAGGEVADIVGRSHFDDEYAALHRSGHVHRVDDEGLPVFEWRGTGKYRPWIISGHQEISELDWAYGTLLSIGLVGARADGMIGITERGLALLEYMGREGDDPDVLLRWRDPQGVNGAQEDIRSMDRWLSSFFRGMKRKVSNLRPWGHVEAGGGFDPNLSCERYIYGELLELTKEDLASPDIASFLDQLENSTFDRSWHSSDFGIVYDRTKLGEPKRSGVWWGVPLGVDSNLESIARWGMVARDQIRLPKPFVRLPAALAKRLSHTHRIVGCGMTYEMPHRLLEVRGALENKWPRNRDTIFRGWHFLIADIDALPKDARELLGRLATLPGHSVDHNRTTFRLTRSRQGIHVVIGFAVSSGLSNMSFGHSRSPHYCLGGAAAFIREHYAPFMEMRGTSEPSSWRIDDRLEVPVIEVDFNDDHTKRIDEILMNSDTGLAPPSH